MFLVPGALDMRSMLMDVASPTRFALLNDNNVAILSVEVREPDLEAVFLSLTGRALRD